MASMMVLTLTAVRVHGYEHGRTWSAAPGECVPGGQGPRAVTLWYDGTSTVSGVMIKWVLSADTTCDSTDPVVGTKVVSASSDLPTFVNTPNVCVPSTMAPGGYRLCAVVDWTGEVVETSETDNVVISDFNFTVTSS